MGAFHSIVLSGDRQTSVLPAFIAGASFTNTSVLIPATRTVSVPLAIQAIASQTANLMEWRNSAGVPINVVDNAGNFGIGTISPSAKLHVSGTNPLSLFGVQIGTSTSTDSLLTITSGVVRKIPVSSYLSTAIISLNGLTAATQTFATPGTAGTAPAWTSATATHTLNIPLASTASVTAGLLSNTDWNTFNNKANTANVWSLTGNAGTASGTNYIGTTNSQSFVMRTNGSQGMVLDSLGNVGIGTAPTFTAGVNREKLLVDAGTATSYNLISGKGSLDGYLQLNIQNRSATASASSDVVASSDNATESINFIDMGINSSVYSAAGILGGANNAYLYSAGNDLIIGNVSSGRPLRFFTTSLGTSSEKLRIDSLGRVGIGTTTPTAALDVIGSIEFNGTLRPNNLPGNVGEFLVSSGGASAPTWFNANGFAWLLAGNGGTVSGTQFLGTTNSQSLKFRTNNIQRLVLDSLGNVGIGSAPGFSVSPNLEKLLVDAGVTTSRNAIVGRGTIDSYLQLNIQNLSGGIAASSDVVATNNTGNETNLINFVDMGINSSGNTSTGVLGGANTGYLYNTGSDFVIGNSTTGRPLRFYTTGSGVSADAMIIDSIGSIGIGTSNPLNKLSVVGTNPVYLAGVQPGAATDSFLTITAGVVRKLPITNGTVYTSLTNGSVPFIGAGGVLTQNNAKFFWDDTNGRLGVGTNTPTSDFTVFQGTGSGPTKGFRFSGNAITGSNNGSGFSMTLGFNQTNNKQLWLGDPEFLGNSSSTFLRASSSNGYSILDAVLGDNSNRRPLVLGVGGDANSGVTLGGDASTTIPSSYIWGNGNMAIGNGYRANAAPANGLLVQGNLGIGATSFLGTNTEKLLIDAGTATVNAIVAKGSINNYLQLNIQNTNAGTNASSDVVATADNGSETTNFVDMGINSSANTSGVMGDANDAYLYNIGQDLLIGTGTAAKSLIFLTGGTSETTNERMRINGTGNVGIGTNNPQQRLDVNGSTYARVTAYVDANATNAGTVAPGLIFGASGGGESISSQRTTGTNQFGINFWTSSQLRMIIYNGGNVGIGTGTAIPADKFTVDGIIAPFTDNNRTLGTAAKRWSVVYAGNGTINTSDRRQKTNIQNLTYGLEDVLALQPVSYNWKKTPNIDKHLGLIAQDVRKVIPEVVVGDEAKETLGINYAELVPVLINAIKDQQKQIDELKQQIKSLQR